MRGLAATLLLAVLAVPAIAAPRLEKVVIVQRHGVRAPTQAPDALAPYARDAWTAWPVAPGELTDHGAAALARMGEALRDHYALAGLLPAKGCAGKDAVFVWADNADQRTRRSGAVMAEALAPNCGLAPAMVEGGKEDPLFHSGDVCSADPAAAQAALATRLARLKAEKSAAYDTARLTLQSILNPGLDPASCAADTSKKCAVAAGTDAARDGKLTGTLAAGSTMSENLFLEYAQGVPAPGWGRVKDAGDLAAIMPLHEFYSDLARGTKIIASAGATVMARQIESVLVGAPAFAGAAPVPPAARLVLLAGHDTNIANLAGMLGLAWNLPDEPDATAPDTALAFELWRDGKALSVRLRLFYQTPDQLRDLTAFDAAHPLPQRTLALAGCTQACAASKARKLLETPMLRQCLKPG